MHLLRIEQSGDLYATGEAVDLGQTPAKVVFLSAADTEISLIAAAVQKTSRGRTALRAANILSLSHPYSIDLYIEKTLAHARAVVIRLLGGVSYWSYGVEEVTRIARQNNIHLALLPGDGKPDAELERLSTLNPDQLRQIGGYLAAGGMTNAVRLLDAMDDIIDGTDKALPPVPFLPAGLYTAASETPGLEDLRRRWDERGLADAPVAALVFYRAQVQAGDTAPVDALIEALEAQGLAAMPVYVSSLKDPASAGLLRDMLKETSAEIILNLTSFAVSDPSSGQRDSVSPGPFGARDVPVLQVMLSSGTISSWQESTAGLSPRDLAMHVVLPELDGRITSRAAGFKSRPRKDPLTEAMLTGYEAHPSSVEYIASLAASWVRLRQSPVAGTRVGMVLANYPNKDGRLANGVGLDTPESAALILNAMAAAGYTVTSPPRNSAELIERLSAAPTNTGWHGRDVEAWCAPDLYKTYFNTLPADIRQAVTDRWGGPEDDPMMGPDGFALPVRLFGNVAVAIQPARGYNIDPKTSYHSPDLPPPHHYLAFYFWLRHVFGAQAVMHLGKHGNLEWLPGKALALDRSCFPDAILGPMPHLYPFIVNDPGEGSQAKRRTSAVILDHLTPPMTLADSHGVMAEIETLMDEYFEAMGLDDRRSTALMDTILMTAERAGLAGDCGIKRDDTDEEKLLKLDNFLCDLKEMQIRDGLHIYGRSPEGRLAGDLITSILRIPRGDGQGAGQSILRSLAADLGFRGFDPLTADRGLPWNGPRPDILADLDPSPWRHQGDTVERLNILAGQLVEGDVAPQPEWGETAAVLNEALPSLRRSVSASGTDEMKFLLKGLGGGYVPAGASGAPTRGRPEVLPTGRNFYSVDSRAIPTEVAWRIGWASASMVIERYVQDHGNYPEAMVLSAWGTANMRTGGDDLAQAMALMGVQPKWDGVSRRITGFEILPLSVLGRPRVDVTLRCSGFFRDAFPQQIALIDKVARAVGALDEPLDQNPLAARMKADAETLITAGMSAEDAALRAGFRVFSSKPGSYGAGLQTLIDEGIWDDRSDFGDVFLGWSGYAYGETADGIADRAGLERRLGSVDAVIHNQDNREHDILDSDDYYQFAGGLSAAVASLKGGDAPVYMGDHSLMERPVIRSLKEEITRVVRGRASNPKWIAGVMRHGYKGAFEIAATLDYLFAFAATTRQVPDHLFDAVYDAWIEDEEVRAFLASSNPKALEDMMNRFAEAVSRDLWQPRRNSVRTHLADRNTGA